jgi:hypothetical protein
MYSVDGCNLRCFGSTTEFSGPRNLFPSLRIHDCVLPSIVCEVAKFCSNRVTSQITHKIAVLIIYKKEIVQLVEDASSFWELNRFDGKFTKPVQIHSLSRKFFLVYKIMMLIMSLQYVLSKLFYNTDKPLAICYGESTGLTPLQDKLYYVLHSASTFEILFLILGFDGLFFYFVAHALAELKMVKVSFYHDRIDNFFVTIEHHVFVLKYFNNTPSPL